MTHFGALRSATEQQHVLRTVSSRRPDLRAVDPVSAVDLRCKCADRSQIRSRIGLAHSEAEPLLATGNGRQIGLALLFGPAAQEHRPDLPVRGPVKRNRSACCQQLLDDDIAFERGALPPAITPGPAHPDKAVFAKRAREFVVDTGPRASALPDGPPLTVPRNQRADRFADPWRGIRKLHRRKCDVRQASLRFRVSSCIKP